MFLKATPFCFTITMEKDHFYWLGFFIFSVLISFTSCYQDGAGFLSLLCGGTTSYTDSSNMTWISDGGYVTTGNITSVIFPEGTSLSPLSVRFFPDSGGRKCYRLPMKNASSLVLVRARFVYKNYDGLGKPPVFSVSLGTAMAANVNLVHTDPWSEEFVWSATKEVVPFCFHSIPNGGFPVISSLELRPLPPGSYRGALGGSDDKFLRKSHRINCGFTDGSLRYPIDQYDRIWDADDDFSPYHVSSGFDIQSNFNLSAIKEDPPIVVLQTGRVLARWNNLVYKLPLANKGTYHVVLYFAGILPVSPTFDVLINGDVVRANFTISRWEASNLFFTVKGIKNLNITLKAISYYPVLNALEVYQIVDIPLECSSTTALQVIQESIGLNLGWQDDPCSPSPWERIGCEGNLVTSLDMHNTSISGEIKNLGDLQNLKKLNLSFNQLTSFGSELGDLINLQVLDLQNNSLQGVVPDSLAELKNLHVLNLENNKLQGPLPQALNRESIEVKASGNLCLSFSLICSELSRNSSIMIPQVTVFTPRKRQSHSHVAILLAAAGAAAIFLFVISCLVVLHMKRRKSKNSNTSEPGKDICNWSTPKIFSYKEIKATTKNFKEAIGRGSFGRVYKGKLTNGKPVAVKVRYDKSHLGADSFLNEVSILSQISHQNLVSLEGFCCESKQQILVYEYLPGGSLADNLYGVKSKKSAPISWVHRLKIAVDAAHGLDYLHNRTNLSIIHRDVKSSNIILDKDMNAKVCDFGFSKHVTQTDATHVTTAVKGTAGYLDPEYYSTQQLTEKSDVYSFGVVLLELICGREPLTHSGSPDSYNLVLWAKPYLQADAFEIVDERIVGSFDAESMRRASSTACRSVERDASSRPTMAQVLAELKEAYSIQLAFLASSGLF